MSMQDAWTNVFASPAIRVTGTDKADFAIVGPRWKGTLPGGVEEVKSPTDIVWVIGRTQVNGKGDVAAVNKIQDQYKLTPLSRWSKTAASRAPVAAPASSARIDLKTSPAEQVAKMDARTFFTRFADLLPGSPPTKDEKRRWSEDLKKLGIVAGQPFDPSKLEATALEGINEAPKATQDAMVAAAKGTGGAEIRNGWTFHLDLGRYGINYGKRAFVAWLGLGSDAPEDEIQMSTRLDAGGKPLDGANKYVLHFDNGKTPPSDAFWSVTLYNDKKLLAAESDRALRNRRPGETDGERGWIARHLHPERQPGRRQGVELAAGAERELHSGAARVLAEAGRAGGPLDAAAVSAGYVENRGQTRVSRNRNSSLVYFVLAASFHSAHGRRAGPRWSSLSRALRLRIDIPQHRDATHRSAAAH